MLPPNMSDQFSQGGMGAPRFDLPQIVSGDIAFDTAGCGTPAGDTTHAPFLSTLDTETRMRLKRGRRLSGPFMCRQRRWVVTMMRHMSSDGSTLR